MYQIIVLITIFGLLSKWLFKLQNEEDVWQELLHNKYLYFKTLPRVEAKPTDSPFWKGMMKVKYFFFMRSLFEVGDDQSTSFWENNWLEDNPLAVQYPSLYNTALKKDDIVQSVLGSAPLNIQFWRALIGNKWTAWLHLVS